MARIRSWYGNGATAGTVAALSTASTSIGPGDSPFDAVTGTVNVDTTGTNAPRLSFPAGTAIQRVAWTIPATSGIATSFALNVSALPPSQNTALVQGLTTGGTAQSFRAEFSLAGALVLRNAANTVVGTSGGTLAVATDYRIELIIDAAGNATITAYTLGTTTVVTSTTGAVGTTHDTLRYGTAAVSASSVPVWTMDEIRVFDVASLAEPVADQDFYQWAQRPPGFQSPAVQFPQPGDSDPGSTGTSLSSDATLPLSDVITSDGVVGAFAGAAIALAVGIAATGVIGTSSGATVNETTTVAAAGAVGTSSGATLAETTTITAAGQVALSTGAALPLADAITTTGAVGTASGATVPLTVTIAAAGSVTSGLSSSATLAETAGLTAAGQVGTSAGASRSQTVATTATGQVGASAGASASESVAVTSAGQVGAVTGATRSETATLLAAGQVGKASGASVAETVSITAAGTVARSGGATATYVVGITAAGSVGGTLTPAGPEFTYPAAVVVHRQTADVVAHTIAAQVATHIAQASVVRHTQEVT